MKRCGGQPCGQLQADEVYLHAVLEYLIAVFTLRFAQAYLLVRMKRKECVVSQWKTKKSFDNNRSLSGSSRRACLE